MHSSMKILSGLLAVYMLTLVFMPCKDECTTNSYQISSPIQDHQEHHENEQDLCSPFCLCSCCGNPVSVSQYYANLYELTFSVRIFHPYFENGNPAPTADMWQPPRLS